MARNSLDGSQAIVLEESLHDSGVDLPGNGRDRLAQTPPQDEIGLELDERLGQSDENLPNCEIAETATPPSSADMADGQTAVQERASTVPDQARQPISRRSPLRSCVMPAGGINCCKGWLACLLACLRACVRACLLPPRLLALLV